MVDKEQTLNAFFLAVLAVAVLSYGYQTMRSTIAPWYGPTVLQEEVEAADWVDKNLPKMQQFAADLFGCEMITAVARQICSIGGAWELADRTTERYLSTEKAFLTDSAEEAGKELKRFEVQYVLVVKRTSFYAFGWKEPNIEKFKDARFFELLYRKGNAYVYKVK